MGLRDRVRSLFYPRERKQVVITPTWERGKPKPLPVDYYTLANAGYAKNEIVYACIRHIANSACEAKVKVLQQDKETEVPDTHPLRVLLDAPNDAMSFYDVIETLLTMMLVSGNAYVEKERGSNTGAALKLWPMRPDRIEIVPDKFGVKSYTYKLGDYETSLPADNVIHFRWFDPRSDWFGLSPLAVCARTADADNQRTDFTRAFFENAAVPYGLLKTRVKIEEAEAMHIRDRWKTQHSGIDNWHNIAVLDVDADYEQLGLSQADMAFPDLTMLSESRICLAFGVPPILIGSYVGLAHATYSNYEQARAAFWEETMAPVLRKLEDTLNLGLGQEFDCYIELDTSEVKALQEDRNEVITRVNEGVTGGWMTVNEGRIEAGLDKLDGHDVFLRPFGLQVIGLDGEMVSSSQPMMDPFGEAAGQRQEERDAGERVSEEDRARLNRPNGQDDDNNRRRRGGDNSRAKVPSDDKAIITSEDEAGNEPPFRL